MTPRKGEITRDDLKAQMAESRGAPGRKVRDPVNRGVIFCAAGVLSASPRTSCAEMTANSWCSASPSRKTRRLLPSALVVSGCQRKLTVILKTSRRPKPVVQDERQAVAKPTDFAR
jgi:hypothetical protein